MKMKKFNDLNCYDFSNYAEEITGDTLFKINGGAEIENSNKGVANAKPGDTLTRKDGTTVTITQGDIDWAKKQVGESETTATNSTPTSVTETSNSQPQQTSKSSVRTSSEYQGVPPQYWDALDEQKAKRQKKVENVSNESGFQNYKWNDMIIQGYRDYVSDIVLEYEKTGKKFTCEDLPLSVLIDYAYENNLPKMLRKHLEFIFEHGILKFLNEKKNYISNTDFTYFSDYIYSTFWGKK